MEWRSGEGIARFVGRRGDVERGYGCWSLRRWGKENPRQEDRVRRQDKRNKCKEKSVNE